MLLKHPQPLRKPDPEVLVKVEKLQPHYIWALVEAGPDDPDSGKFYPEAYQAAGNLERKAVALLEL
jgi:hypothetical protein